MVTKEDILFVIKRFGNFLKLFVRNKRGVLGVSIIMAFVIITFGAPLITPYSPLGWRPKGKGVPLSGRLTAPTWLKHLPPELGGRKDLSENLNVAGSAGSFAATPSSVTAHAGPGSFVAIFQRKEGEEPYGRVAISFTREFDFPYTGPPGRFRGNIDLLVNGTTHEEKEPYYEKLDPEEDPSYRDLNGDGVGNEIDKKLIEDAMGSSDGIADIDRDGDVDKIDLGLWLFGGQVKNYTKGRYWDVPVEVHVFIQRTNGTRLDLWPYYHPPEYYPPAGFSEDSGTGSLLIKRYSDSWIRSMSGSISSEAGIFALLGIDPVRKIFTKMPGSYIWGLEIIFDDSLRSDLNGDGVGNETDKNIIQSALGSYEPIADLNEDDMVDEDDLELWQEYKELDYVKGVEAAFYFDRFSLRLDGTGWGLLGTDERGRDLFAQLIYGTRISLYVGVLSSVLGVVIGLTVGLASGYLGRLVDEILMRFADMLLVLPGLPLLIVLVAVLGTDIEVLILLLGFLGWMGFSRLVRSQVLSLRERPFVEAAKAVGSGNRHIIFRHILPNVMSLVYVSLATAVPGAIVAEASLAWLGFYDPKRMSWGRMLHHNFDQGAIANWWWGVPPGLCIAALAIAFILIGYSLDEILNPRLRKRR